MGGVARSLDDDDKLTTADVEQRNYTKLNLALKNLSNKNR